MQFKIRYKHLKPYGGYYARVFRKNRMLSEVYPAQPPLHVTLVSMTREAAGNDARAWIERTYGKVAS